MQCREDSERRQRRRAYNFKYRIIRVSTDHSRDICLYVPTVAHAGMPFRAAGLQRRRFAVHAVTEGTRTAPWRHHGRVTLRSTKQTDNHAPKPCCPDLSRLHIRQCRCWNRCVHAHRTVYCLPISTSTALKAMASRTIMTPRGAHDSKKSTNRNETMFAVHCTKECAMRRYRYADAH